MTANTLLDSKSSQTKHSMDDQIRGGLYNEADPKNDDRIKNVSIYDYT